MKKLSRILVVVLSIGIIASVYASFQFYRPPSIEGTRQVTIEPGMSVKQIGAVLHDADVIRSRWWFEASVYLLRRGTSLQAGDYTFTSTNLFGVVGRLTAGEPRATVRLTFPEGWTRADMANAVSEKIDISRDAYLAASDADALERLRSSYSFLESVPKGHSLEGFLFPDTYDVFLDVDASALVGRQLENFGTKMNQEMRDRSSSNGRSIFDTIIMASVIEREVRTVRDMKVVGGIFWKRIESGVPLQADSTVNYVTGGTRASITLEETRLDSPYNTYLYLGLPKGPISNPGLNALRAVVEPQESAYWFFLSKPSGETVFSRTLDEHNAAKQKYLK